MNLFSHSMPLLSFMAKIRCKRFDIMLWSIFEFRKNRLREGLRAKVKLLVLLPADRKTS
jgi:hypothetical protein